MNLPPDSPNRKRSCGTCSACCWLLGIAEIEKSPCSRCPHQRGIGCGIYESRPKDCRTYQCLWLASGTRPPLFGTGRDRPDKLKVIFDVNIWNGITAVAARELVPGAANRRRAKALIEELARYIPVSVLPPLQQDKTIPSRILYTGPAVSPAGEPVREVLRELEREMRERRLGAK